MKKMQDTLLYVIIAIQIITSAIQTYHIKVLKDQLKK
nr:MAG TPA: hypothetical protein [Caudoviricetes sp.]